MDSRDAPLLTPQPAAGPRAAAPGAPEALRQRLVERGVEVLRIEAAAIAALSGPQDVPTQKNAEFQAKRDQVLAAMNAIPGVVCPRPQGAFYVFPDISCAFGKSHKGVKIENDVDFCNALLDAKGVACVPGSAFGEPRALRISYTCPTPQLAPGLARFQEFFAELA